MADSIFQSANFVFPTNPRDYAPVRECQFGGYWSCVSHFTSSTEPALLSIPTGAGKTALMTALAFGLAAHRVLVINPSEVLRDQISQEFESLEHLRGWHAVAQLRPPRVKRNEHRLATRRDWEALRRFEVVCATPNTVSPAQPGVCHPPDELFDLIFFDEAHHAPATTWAALLTLFPAARYVLLTATPFRRDKRRIDARLIYHYPIKKALESGIYKPVIYKAVESAPTRSSRDLKLCLAARRVFRRLKSSGKDARILVRTDRVEWSETLTRLYNENGIRVASVDYTRSLAENKLAIDQVRNGELNGMVCVGMLGEGLDIPELKLAVLHSAPQTLPFTIQFIGRVARSHASHRQLGDAYLFSIPDEVIGEMRRLHHEDSDWQQLIPELVERAVQGTNQEKKYLSVDENFNIDPRSLKPFFSVRVYDASKHPLDHNAQPELPEETAVRFHGRVDDTDVIITETEATPIWARDTGIVTSNVDLHIFFREPATGLLFESTGSDSVAASLRKALVGADVPRIPATLINHALSDAPRPNYIMIGLRNLVSRGPAEPSYKTFMGSEVQSALRPSDAKSFGAGHALARINLEETRGVAGSQARLWAIKRATVGEFEDWCRDLTALLRAKRPLALPQLDWLASPRSANQLQTRPIGVSIDHSIARFEATFRGFNTGDPADSHAADIVPYLDVIGFHEGIVQCAFFYGSNRPPVQLEFSPTLPQLWQRLGGFDVRVTLQGAHSREFEGTLVEYLTEYPPTFVLSDSEVVIGRDVYQLPGTVALPSDLFVVQDWRGCDITSEDANPPGHRLNIHDWLERRFRRERNVVVVKDHLSGEMADFILLQRNPAKRIVFFHCKASDRQQPGVRVNDAYEVLGQAVRTDRFVLNRKLLRNLIDRLDRRQNTRLVQGRRTTLENWAAEFVPTEWACEVVVVQPGFDARRIIAGQRLHALILATFEWLANCQCRFSIWSS